MPNFDHDARALQFLPPTSDSSLQSDSASPQEGEEEEEHAAGPWVGGRLLSPREAVHWLYTNTRNNEWVCGNFSKFTHPE